MHKYVVEGMVHTNEGLCQKYIWKLSKIIIYQLLTSKFNAIFSTSQSYFFYKARSKRDNWHCQQLYAMSIVLLNQRGEWNY